MPDLKIDVRNVGNIAVVEPVGYINAHTAKNFETVLQDLIDRKQHRIVINCHGLEYVASAGLGVIMGFVRTTATSGCATSMKPCSISSMYWVSLSCIPFLTRKTKPW